MKTDQYDLLTSSGRDWIGHDHWCRTYGTSSPDCGRQSGITYLLLDDGTLFDYSRLLTLIFDMCNKDIVYFAFDSLIVSNPLPSLIEVSEQSYSEFFGRFQSTLGLYSSLLLKPSEFCYLYRRAFITYAKVGTLISGIPWSWHQRTLIPL